MNDKVCKLQHKLRSDLLINPWLCHGCVLLKFFSKPQSDFLVGRVNRVTSVADVSSNINAVVSPDGARFPVLWVGGSQHLAPHFYYIFAFPDHSKDWPRAHVF